MAKLASRSVPALLEALSEGLALIAEHVAALESAITEPGRRRANAAIRVVSEEEAGKYLVLLDVVRCARAPIGLRSRQLRRANDHLAKGIYARAAEIRPATFGELMGYVETLRRSHYLDGPNDVDWIFRNEIEARREAELYVDFVETDEGDDWQSPRYRDDLMVDPPSDACELVGSLHSAGFSTPQGLAIVAEVWDGFRPDRDTHWREVQALSDATLARLPAPQVAPVDDADLARIARTWTFPLWHIELDRIEVDVDELRRRQQNWHPDL
jgi:hypothetical protein